MCQIQSSRFVLLFPPCVISSTIIDLPDKIWKPDNILNGILTIRNPDKKRIPDSWSLLIKQILFWRTFKIKNIYVKVRDPTDLWKLLIQLRIAVIFAIENVRVPFFLSLLLFRFKLQVFVVIKNRVPLDHQLIVFSESLIAVIIS